MEEVNRLWQHITEPFSWAVWQHCVFTWWRRTHRQTQAHTFRVTLQIPWLEAATSAAFRETEDIPCACEFIASHLRGFSKKKFFSGWAGGSQIGMLLSRLKQFQSAVNLISRGFYSTLLFFKKKLYLIFLKLISVAITCITNICPYLILSRGQWLDQGHIKLASWLRAN